MRPTLVFLSSRACSTVLGASLAIWRTTGALMPRLPAVCVAPIQRLTNANMVCNCAVLLTTPWWRTLTNLNWRLRTRNGCSIRIRMPAFMRLCCSVRASVGLAGSSRRRLPGRTVMSQVTSGLESGRLPAPCSRRRHRPLDR